MGAFGVGAFENDDALDWLADAVETDVAGAIDKLLGTVHPKLKKVIREDKWAQILAAAALIAHSIKPQPKVSRLLKGLKIDSAMLDGLATPARKNSAQIAISIMTKPGNPLREEWVDSGLVDEWENELRKLDRILSPAE